MTKPCVRICPWEFAAMLFLCLPPLFSQAAAPAAAQQNVILVMTDGLRWQEVFRGADESLLTPKRFYDGRSVDALKSRYLASTPEERRNRLMPFLWGTLIPQGQIFGDQDEGSVASVTNGFNFSYPGYSETLTGHADSRIDSNDNRPNPNQTVLEWINKQSGFSARVAAFGAWETIAYIVNQDRCGFPVNASYAPLKITPTTPALDLLNGLKADSPRVWDDEVFDAPTFYTALEYIKLRKPRVLFLSLGETDDWAHGNNYGEYLEAAHRVDTYLDRLWTTLQSMPEYRGNTTLIFTTDHGRGTGTGPDDGGSWESHGKKIPDSRNIFIALLGRGVPSAGIRQNVAPVTQSQVAATLAAFAGLDWNSAEPKADPAIRSVTK